MSTVKPLRFLLMQPPASQQQRVSEAMSRLPSIATSKSHHLPNGKHPQGHAQSLPGTPTEPNQQDSSSGAAGSSRKSPSTMMRPRSTQVLLPETLRYGTTVSSHACQILLNARAERVLFTEFFHVVYHKHAA